MVLSFGELGSRHLRPKVKKVGNVVRRSSSHQPHTRARLRAYPRHEEFTIALSEESDGTQRLLDLVSALYFGKSCGAVYLIDEIDRRMHPLLV